MNRSTSSSDSPLQLAMDLVRLLHQASSAEDFAQRLALAEDLPAATPGKSQLVETVRMAMGVRNRLELLQQIAPKLLGILGPDDR